MPTRLVSTVPLVIGYWLSELAPSGSGLLACSLSICAFFVAKYTGWPPLDCLSQHAPLEMPPMHAWLNLARAMDSRGGEAGDRHEARGRTVDDSGNLAMGFRVRLYPLATLQLRRGRTRCPPSLHRTPPLPVGRPPSPWRRTSARRWCTSPWRAPTWRTTPPPPPGRTSVVVRPEPMALRQ